MPGPLELRSPFWWLRWVPAVVLAVLMPQLLYVAGRVAVVPVLASFALAYLVNPLVERFETRGLSRTVASIAALLVVGLMVSSSRSSSFPICGRKSWSPCKVS
jgi:predicted PurR-regulated permease PerM